MANTSEGELVLAARAGDERAFGQLFDAWFDRVHDLSRRIVHDPGIAAEVAQDSFLKAWTRIESLDDPDAFGGWLLRIARNGSLNRLEKERRAVTADDETIVGQLDRGATDDDPFDQLDEAGRVELVWEAAAALGPKDLSVLDLHLRHGLAPKELAEELGCTPNNAHQVLFTMRKRLGGAIRAFVLWRAGRPTCPALRDALAAAAITRFDGTTVKVIDTHVEVCAECADARTDRVAPAALFAAAPIVAAPLAFKISAAEGLSESGVPMTGSSAMAPGGGASLGGGVGVSETAAVTGAVGGAVGGDDGGDDDDGGNDDGGDHGSDDGGDLPRSSGRGRPLVAAGVVIVLAVLALLLWPRGNDAEEVSSGPITSTTERRSTTTSKGNPSTTTEDTTVGTMVLTGRDGGTTPDGGTIPAGDTGSGTGQGGSGSSTQGGSGGGTGAGGGGSGSGSGAGGGGNTQQNNAPPKAPKPTATLDATLDQDDSSGCRPSLETWILTWTTSNATSVEVSSTSPVASTLFNSPLDGTGMVVCAAEGSMFRVDAVGPGGSGSASDGGDVVDTPPPLL